MTDASKTRSTSGSSSDSVASRHYLELQLLLEVSQAVATTLDLDRVLQIISDGTAQLIAVETAAIYLLEGERLYLGATTPLLDPVVPEAVRWVPLADHPHIGRAVATQNPVCVVNALDVALSPAERAVVELRGLRSLLFLPFCHEGDVVGVLILGTVREPRAFTDREIDLCRTLTNQLALGVQNARLHAGLRAHAEELETQIAERVRAERELRQSEAKFRALFEQAGDYLLLLRLDDAGRLCIVDANQAACGRHGYRHEELCGSPLTLLDQGLTHACSMALLEQVQGGRVHRFVTEHVRRDGTIFPVEATAAQMVLEDGTSFVILTGRDITERQALAEQLRQAQKMEAVGQLAGGVAHDLNNLLQVIRGFADIAREEVAPDEDTHESLGFVLQAASRATSLVSQLLAFARRQVLTLKSVDLGQLIHNLLPMLRPLLGENIEVTVRVSGGLSPLRADPNQLEQILINLCVNGRDAMPEGGSFTLAAENVIVDDTLCQRCGLKEPGPYVLLTVADTGCGMDALTLSRAFEPFFTTKGLGEGTGLGLASVYGLVQQHQGSVQVTSALGDGTTFEIYLPAAKHAESQDGTQDEMAVGAGRETILIAEDHELVLRLARVQLARNGYQVIAARDGDEAKRLLDTRSRDIDLALLDVVMPKIGGEAVFHHLRERRPKLPVVFCSAHGASALTPCVVSSESVTVLRKPFDENTLLRTVREALSQKS